MIERIADYFVVVGLPDDPVPQDEIYNEAAIKPSHKLDPIIDIAVINKSLGEKVPKGYSCIDHTPSGLSANLNHGSIRSPEMYICVRRGRDRPLADIGVLYEGKEVVKDDCEIVSTTPQNHSANINNSNTNHIYLTYRRANENSMCDSLAVNDICVINASKGESPPHAYCQIQKNLNKSVVGSSMFICYKKSMVKTDFLAYKPGILFRYPQENHESFPLPDSVPLFCLPMGATLETWPYKTFVPNHLFSTFILTLSDGEKVYGAAVNFYEKYDDARLTDVQLRCLGLKNKKIRDEYNINTIVLSKKCICLLSHWPFFNEFQAFLFYLLKLSVSGPHSVPIERHISHFMFEVPFPSLQRPRILVQLQHETIYLGIPDDLPIPQSGGSFVSFLKNLGPENCMNILLYILTEQKLVLHSLRPAVLTSVAEAVASIIFPFHWQCPYIPLCPIGLAGVLNAPCPFIIGIESRYFDLYDPPSDVICIDLDTMIMWPPDDKRPYNWKILPKRPLRVLHESLNKLLATVDEHQDSSKKQNVQSAVPTFEEIIKKRRKELAMEISIQEVFLRFMACLMKGYKHFLRPIQQAPTQDTTAAASLFDMHGFFKSRDKSHSRFFSQFMKTQLFIRFIEERSFVSDNDASLAFFDDCTEKVEETKEEPRLLELDNTHDSERTVFILPPDTTGLPPGVEYTYDRFPELQYELFLQKKMSTLHVNSSVVPPSSPMARRSKMEIKSALKAAHEQVAAPTSWAKCLLSNCYSLWFIHLPSFIEFNKPKVKALYQAYELLKKMQDEKLEIYDEICYRVLLQLCGQNNSPALAVKVLAEMKKSGLHPNAITYGYYNKAVFESTWVSPLSRGSELWTKLRNVVTAVGLFKLLVSQRKNPLHRSASSNTEGEQVSIDSCLGDTFPLLETTGKVDGSCRNNGIVRESQKQSFTLAAKSDSPKDSTKVKRGKLSHYEKVESRSSLNSMSTNSQISVNEKSSLESCSTCNLNPIPSAICKALPADCSDSGVCLNETGQSDGEFVPCAISEMNKIERKPPIFDKGDKSCDVFSSSRDIPYPPTETSIDDVQLDQLLNVNVVGSSENSQPYTKSSVVAVTQHDPLGWFSSPTVSHATQSAQMAVGPNVDQRANQTLAASDERLFNNDDAVSKTDSNDSEPTSITSAKSEQPSLSNANLYDDQRPLERSRSLVPHALGTAAMKGWSKLVELGRASSTPESLSATDKPRVWPLRFSKSTSTDGGAVTGRFRVKDFTLQRTQSLRRSREQFTAAVRSATKSVASKVTEYVSHYMTTQEQVVSSSESDVASDEVNLNVPPEEVASLATNDLPTNLASPVDASFNDDGKKSDDFGPCAVDMDDRQISIDDNFMNLEEHEDKTGTLRSLSEHTNDITAQLDISSCCRCPHCRCVLYDEEIMTGWSPDNSNLNTRCVFCSTKLVPHLQIFIKDQYDQSGCGNVPPAASVSAKMNSSPNRISSVTTDIMIDIEEDINKSPYTNSAPDLPSPIIVPYLSPLVLRKELETILISEGDVALMSDEFADNHPIIFWNLVWYFKRINVPSHLQSFVLTAKTIKCSASWNRSVVNPTVIIRPLWDNPAVHDKPGLPLYKVWKQDSSSAPFNLFSVHIPKELMENIMEEIDHGLLTPIIRIINLRRKIGGRKTEFRSIYREILFFLMISIGRDKINHDAFDKSYDEAYSKLSPSDLRSLQPDDKPRPMKTRWCRKLFEQLDV